MEISLSQSLKIKVFLNVVVFLLYRASKFNSQLVVFFLSTSYYMQTKSLFDFVKFWHHTYVIGVSRIIWNLQVFYKTITYMSPVISKNLLTINLISNFDRQPSRKQLSLLVLLFQLPCWNHTGCRPRTPSLLTMRLHTLADSLQSRAAT